MNCNYASGLSDSTRFKMSRTRKSFGRLALAATLFALSLCASALDDAKITIEKASTSPSLTVRYTGAAAKLAELKINGDSFGTRVLDSSLNAGETNFTLTNSVLSDGDNDVEVRLFDADGKIVGTEHTTIHVVKSNKPKIAFSGLTPGQTVQGPVELKVDLATELKNVYVSFFVDSHFKLMSNFPPFGYTWDTMRESNGWHELEAWAVDDSSETFKSKRLRIFVNNPSGHTTRIFTSAPAIKPTAPVAPSKAISYTVSSNPSLLAKVEPAIGAKYAVGAASTSAGAVVSRVPVSGAPVEENPATATISKNFSNLKLTRTPSPVATSYKLLTPTGSRNADLHLSQSTNPVPTIQGVTASAKPVGAAPVALVNDTTKAPTVHPATTLILASTGHSSHPMIGLEPVKPAMPAPVKPATKPVAPAVPAVPKPVTKPVAPAKMTTALIPVRPGFTAPRKGAYAVVMDGRLVEFDVEPRFDEGVPMAPFRHLVEKHGGSVKWEAATQSVSAKSDGRAIFLQIGAKVASIDQNSVELERAPYLDRGRTIVPMSFMRETLHVNVEYDKATNHILITSIK